MENLLELSLIRTPINGSIPKEIENLTSLEWMDLHLNKLACTIPIEIRNLRSLSYFDINGNSISGTIPTEIGSLKRLEYLDVGGNLISGTIPTEIGNLRILNFLDFLTNSLSGTIPKEIGNCTLLTNFFLSNNNLSGTIPPEFTYLTKLKELNLSYNKLSGTIPSFLAYFNILDLSYNQLSGTVPLFFGTLSSLDLSNNQLSGTIPKLSLTLASPMNIDLSSNNFNGLIPNWFQIYPNLYFFSNQTNYYDQTFNYWIRSFRYFGWCGVVVFDCDCFQSKCLLSCYDNKYILPLLSPPYTVKICNTSLNVTNSTVPGPDMNHSNTSIDYLQIIDVQGFASIQWNGEPFVNISNSKVQINENLSIFSLALFNSDVIVNGSYSITNGSLLLLHSHLIIKESMKFGGTMTFIGISLISCFDSIEIQSTTIFVDWNKKDTQELISFTNQSKIDLSSILVKITNTDQPNCYHLQVKSFKLILIMDCESANSNHGLIGGIVGGVIGFIFVVGLVYFPWRMKKEKASWDKFRGKLATK
uniref:Disease resistance R13L4/SHOC-2-like LRR domain-containing protein n=1 Tax=Arcella intermedia TaxID=1963864 RepID=A0A6B2L141_9EUKA